MTIITNVLLNVAIFCFISLLVPAYSQFLNLASSVFSPPADPYGYKDPSGCLLAKDVCPNGYIKCYLSTTAHQEDILLDTDNINRSQFMDAAVMMILHGLNGNHVSEAKLSVGPALFATRNCNIIAVDCHALMPVPCYLEAMKNLEVIAKCLVWFIENILIKKLGFSLQNITIIGHSLGAQCAGLMGQMMNIGKLKLIVGLDPAYPGYWGLTTPSYIDSSDADYVMAVHTNSGCMGTPDPCGHADYYVNDGKCQPGCSELDCKCSHMKACTIFAQSIYSYGYWAYKCPNVSAIMTNPGSCSDDYSPFMGDKINKSMKGVFRVDTSCSDLTPVGMKKNYNCINMLM